VRPSRAHRPGSAERAEKISRPAISLAVELPRRAPVPSETAVPSDDTSTTGAGTGAGPAVASSAAAAIGSFVLLLAALSFALVRRRPRGRRLSLAPTPCTSALLFAAVERPG
jgi:hypothetical protein